MNFKHLAAKILTPGLKKFSNRHKGESCYIFGDGPSVKWFDLSLFNDRTAICCGLFPFHKDFPKLNVKYISMVEPWAFVPKFMQPKILHDFRPVLAAYREFIQGFPDKELFVSLSNRLSLSGKNIHYVYKGLPEYRNHTDKLLDRFDLFGGSFHASLTLAYYLGFKKIYLVGFDAWTIQKPARTGHWYELGEGTLFEPTNFANDFLELIKNVVDIFTISLDGKSQNVTQINYDNYTGKTGKYRENYELIDKQYLDVFAKYPDYRIYP